jgi:hypothetical protein
MYAVYDFWRYPVVVRMHYLQLDSYEKGLESTNVY